MSAHNTDDDVTTWLAILRASGRSPNTLKQYGYVMAPLVEHLGRPLREMTRAEAAAWVEQARFRWSAGGVYTRLKVWRSFFGWLVNEEIIDRSPFKGLSVKEPQAVQPTCTDEQLDAMLDGASRQERAILLTLADTGMRKGECAALEFADVSITAGTINVRISKTRPRVVPMSDRLVVTMSRWLRERGTKDGPLWVSSRESQDAYSWVRTVLDRRSGNTVTAHQLRRRFCVNWLLKGGSESSLVRLLGWADATMVSTYVRAAADEISASEYRRLVG